MSGTGRDGATLLFVATLHIDLRWSPRSGRFGLTDLAVGLLSNFHEQMGWTNGVHVWHLRFGKWTRISRMIYRLSRGAGCERGGHALAVHTKAHKRKLRNLRAAHRNVTDFSMMRSPACCEGGGAIQSTGLLLLVNKINNKERPHLSPGSAPCLAVFRAYASRLMELEFL